MPGISWDDEIDNGDDVSALASRSGCGSSLFTFVFEGESVSLESGDDEDTKLIDSVLFATVSRGTGFSILTATKEIN